MVNEFVLKMQKGDKATIIEGLSHKGAIFRMNAIGNVAIHRLNDPRIISELVKLKEDNALLDGYTVADFATAALDVLGHEEYTGDDRRMKELIESEFDFLV